MVIRQGPPAVRQPFGMPATGAESELPHNQQDRHRFGGSGFCLGALGLGYATAYAC